LGYDIYLAMRARRLLIAAEPGQPPPELPGVTLRWRSSVALALLAWAPLLVALSIVVVPEGMAGVRVSQISGTLPGTLYPGVHVVRPFVDRVVVFDTRDQLFTTGMVEDHKGVNKADSTKPELLNVQAREGLTLGLAITIRYRLDPRRLDYVLDNLPQPVERALVPPIVSRVWQAL